MEHNNDFDKALRIIKETNKNRPITFGCCSPTIGPTGPTEVTGSTEPYKNVNNKFQIITITEIMVLFCSKLLLLSSHQFLSYL